MAARRRPDAQLGRVQCSRTHAPCCREAQSARDATAVTLGSTTGPRVCPRHADIRPRNLSGARLKTADWCVRPLTAATVANAGIAAQRARASCAAYAAGALRHVRRFGCRHRRRCRRRPRRPGRCPRKDYSACLGAHTCGARVPADWLAGSGPRTLNGPPVPRAGPRSQLGERSRQLQVGRTPPAAALQGVLRAEAGVFLRQGVIRAENLRPRQGNGVGQKPGRAAWSISSAALCAPRREPRGRQPASAGGPRGRTRAAVLAFVGRRAAAAPPTAVGQARHGYALRAGLAVGCCARARLCSNILIVKPESSPIRQTTSALLFLLSTRCHNTATAPAERLTD